METAYHAEPRCFPWGCATSRRYSNEYQPRRASSTRPRQFLANRLTNMSAITETEPGGEMVCILAFSARPRSVEGEPIPGDRRRFQIGERVRYLTSFYKNTPGDNPTGYMAVFEPTDGKDHTRYAATQSYFVSIDCWDALKEHFAATALAGNAVATRSKKSRHSAKSAIEAVPKK
jgi:hypothetical protein